MAFPTRLTEGFAETGHDVGGRRAGPGLVHLEREPIAGGGVSRDSCWVEAHLVHRRVHVEDSHAKNVGTVRDTLECEIAVNAQGGYHVL